jgi:glycosyltransferase involved in cell wall biosynthesis
LYTKYKLGFLLPNLDNHGGITVSVLTITTALEALGHEVHLFPVGKTEVAKTPNTHPIDSNKKSAQLKLFKLAYDTQNSIQAFDMLISNNLRTNYILHKLQIENALMVFHNSMIIKKRGFFKTMRQRMSYKALYHSQNIAFVSECFRDEFLKKYHTIVPKKSYVIYNPISLGKLQELASEPYEPMPEKYLICVGRMSKEKNQAMIIKALSKLQDKEIDLVLLGDGVEMAKLKTLTQEMKLTSRIYFLGWKTNPYPYIKNASLLVSASKNEGMPMTLLEALALKTPVVSTDILCGPNEILTAEFSHFLTKPLDLDDFVQKIDQALISYPIIAESAIEKFKVDTIVNHYLGIIKEIV